MLQPVTLYQASPNARKPTQAVPQDTDRTMRLEALNERGVQILEAILTAGYMTTPQIQRVFFRGQPGSRIGPRKNCERFVRLLTKAGYLRTIEQAVRRGEGRKPRIFALDAKGAHYLIAELGVDPRDAQWQPNPVEDNALFLRHLLAINDVRIAFAVACEQHGVVIADWTTDRELKQAGTMDYILIANPDGREHKAAVIPDSLFTLQRGEKIAPFLLEIDLRHVTVQPTKWEQRGWHRKIVTYLAYFSSEKFYQRYQGKRAQVLTVTTGDLRLHHMLETTIKAGGDARFWFTTFNRLTPENTLTGKIWTRATRAGTWALLS